MASCISIPSESVQLSEQVGQMIRGLRIAHFNMVNRHFDHLENDLEDFVFNEYKAALIKNVEQLIQEEDPNFEGLTIEQYDKIIERLFEKRNRWLQELRKDRHKITGELEEYYVLLAKANIEITNLLSSASNLSKARDRILGSEITQKSKELEAILIKSTDRAEIRLAAALAQLGE